MKRTFFVVFLLTVFCAALALPQVKSTSSKKKTTTTKTSAKKGKASSKTVKRAPVAAYRQATPTPERYKEIQQALADKGYLKSEPNGVWDAESSAALAKFQSDRKLDATGKLSAASLIALGLGPSTAPIPPVPAVNKPGDAAPASPPAKSN